MNITPLIFELAGIRVRLECMPETFAAAILARYGLFVSEAGSETPVELTAQVCFEGPRLPLTAADPQVQFVGAECRLSTPGAQSTISLPDHAAEITLYDAAPLIGLEYFLRVLYALLAEAQGGLMLHCAGVLAESGVHLFVGHSGAGKSTASAYSADHATVLNDDLVVLRPDQGRWMAFGTPFWNVETTNRQGQTAGGPLVGIYRLVKDPQVYLAPMSRAAAVAELFANCPVVNADPSRAPTLLTRCRQLLAAVAMQQLHFRKDATFWSVLTKDQGPKTKDGGERCN